MLTFKHKGKVWNAYTPDERRDAVYWKDASDGDMALTDDGFVLDCISRKVYRGTPYIRLSGGGAFAHKTAKFEFLPRYHAGRFGSRVSTAEWDKQEAGRTRTKDAIKVYVAQMLGGKGIDWEQVGRAYRADQQIPEASVRRVFKQERIQRMIREEVQKIFYDKGFTEEFVVEQLKEALKMAKDDRDLPNMLRALENAVTLLDMKPKNEKKIEQIEMHETAYLGSVEREERSLKASRETPLIGGKDGFESKPASES